MEHRIKRYPVRHPLLQRYISFFWELKIDQAELNHWLIPQRNVNMRFNLSDTPHYLRHEDNVSKLETVYFPGLQSRFLNSSLIVSGKVDVIGISFAPDGFHPFLKVPGSEFRDQVLGADEIGLRVALLVLPWLGFLLNTWLGLLVGLAVYTGSRLYAPEEEKILARIFGERWDSYRKKVLLPWL
ncbi:hypothetical protein EG830_11845 [bacterium]|nr:hypothetical protein [bacterium]